VTLQSPKKDTDFHTVLSVLRGFVYCFYPLAHYKFNNSPELPWTHLLSSLWMILWIEWRHFLLRITSVYPESKYNSQSPSVTGPMLVFKQ
jgi:hypothetical protein